MEMGNKNKEQIADVGSVVEAVSSEDGDAPLYKVERQKWDNNVLDDFDSALPKGPSRRSEERKKVDPQTTEACAKGNSPFTLILDDPAGNGFIENLYSAHEEVMTFPSTCGTCSAYCENRVFVTRIPYLQEVIVMASTCDACGYRNSELKPGGRVPEKGKKITLCVKNIKDLSRDVINSDSASVKVPELDLELAIVTTVEVLITKISESLERVHGFTFGDSLKDSKRNKWLDFKARLNKLPSLLDFNSPR
ncbi:hypothetical protein EZV62_016992 [Acer yangbiense]|uniref:Zinc finger ZPR1-type domain-containing protein n=1 Tax=Acer yangbiense TaxID=1000413 RepID=A0A5C7HQ20_9ROSI|nr:hypothetical protein EZV62_016992 [Acer yangbiense]